MKKIYLVDSENVGDVWVPLLVSSQAEDEVMVFYTQKSPHMNYENVRMLKESQKEAVFVKCFEGNNALDFQLVTELGHMLQENADREYIIVSNDTGFDAVVRYWTLRNMPVCRLSGKDCSRKTVRQNQQADDGQAVSSNEKIKKEPENQQKSEKESDQKSEQTVRDTRSKNLNQKISKPQDEGLIFGTSKDTEHIVSALISCISKDNLADFHNALVMFLGEEKGKKIYQEIKGNPEYMAYWAKLPVNPQKEKFDIYCNVVFEHSELAADAPKDFSTFLFKANGKRKNLNSLRAALQGQYGKDKGMRYYSLFKSHIKIMNCM